MTSKKFIATSMAAFAASASFALNYFCGQPDNSQREYKWSTCNWGSEIQFASADLPNKPGTNDNVNARPGGYTLEVDVDANVLSLSVGNNSEIFSNGRKIKVKKHLGVGIALSNNSQTLMDFRNSKVEANSINYTYWSQAKQAGLGIFRLEDSVCTVKNNVISNIPVNFSITDIEGRPGCAITLVGKSVLDIGGRIMMDPIISEQPDTWTFRINLEEKNGALPLLRVYKRSDMTIADINVTLGDSIPKGKYTLIDFQDKKTSVKNARSIRVNGGEYNLGDPIRIGSREGKLVLAKPTNSTARDRQTANDLVLEVK